MNTVAGHDYRIQVQVDPAFAKDPSWLAGPVAAAYPSNILSIAADPPTNAFVTIRRTGGAVNINEGDTIDASVPGTLSLISPTASVVSVEDLGAAPGTQAAWPTPLVAIAAMTLLGVTAYLSMRVR
jgi:hypothetical protein